ncbi:MAG: 16S rRNA (cytosine(1402)-N(4))-methyltransferase [Nitrospiraceae bacterium]
MFDGACPLPSSIVPTAVSAFVKMVRSDMRMDRAEGRTAADLVRELPESELADVLYHLGEERYSRRIARAIVQARREASIETTGRLAAIVERAVPGFYRRTWTDSLRDADLSGAAHCGESGACLSRRSAMPSIFCRADACVRRLVSFARRPHR